MAERRPNKQPGLSSGNTALAVGVMVLVLAALVAAALAWAAARLVGVGYGSPRVWLMNPPGPRWSPDATVAVACESVLLIAVFVPLLWLFRRGRRRPRAWTDDLARVQGDSHCGREGGARHQRQLE